MCRGSKAAPFPLEEDALQISSLLILEGLQISVQPAGDRSPGEQVLTSTSSSTANKALQPGKVNEQGMLTNIDINR